MIDINTLTFIKIMKYIQLIHPGKKVIRLDTNNMGRTPKKVYFGVQTIDLRCYDAENNYVIAGANLNHEIVEVIEFTARIQCYGYNALSFCKHLDTMREAETSKQFFHDNLLTIMRCITLKEISQLVDTNNEERAFIDFSCSVRSTFLIEDVDYFDKITVNGTVSGNINNDKTLKVEA